MGAATGLGDGPHWELQGRVDSARFFRLLGAAFPSATTLFLEGDPSRDVDDFFKSISGAGAFLPDPGTLWPKPKRYVLPMEAATLSALADLAECSAEPEICFHLHVYAGDRPILEWYDALAPDSPAFVATDVEPATLRAFAAAVGFTVTPPKPTA